MMVFFFGLSAVIFYIYIGYPLVLVAVSYFCTKKINKQEYLPRISLIIAAYNEEKIIEQKMLNALALDYPNDKLEIIVFSDGSDDRTEEIVKRYEDRGVKLYSYAGRKGKTYCQNETVKKASGEIIVFSDANSMYDSAALTELIANFSDPAVGVVSGELRYVINDNSEEGLYWKIEKMLKKKESEIGSCLGANGAIYAVRKELYVELPPDVISDFIEPLLIYKQGYRVVYEPRAFCTEETGGSTQEFARKRRIILRSLQSLYLVRDLLNPFRYGFFAVQLWSHKVLRWSVPVFLIGVFVVNMFLLGNVLFQVFFALQMLFYLFACAGTIFRAKLFSIPYYFCVINLASLLAIVNFLRGKRQVVWRVAR